MTPEGRVKAVVKRLIASYGDQVYTHWPVQTGYGAPTLDCTGGACGRAFAVETKAPGKHPTERQKLTIRDMELAGYAVFVIGEYEDIDSPWLYSGLAELKKWLDMVCVPR